MYFGTLYIQLETFAWMEGPKQKAKHNGVPIPDNSTCWHDRSGHSVSKRTATCRTTVHAQQSKGLFAIRNKNACMHLRTNVHSHAHMHIWFRICNTSKIYTACICIYIYFINANCLLSHSFLGIDFWDPSIQCLPPTQRPLKHQTRQQGLRCEELWSTLPWNGQKHHIGPGRINDKPHKRSTDKTAPMQLNCLMILDFQSKTHSSPNTNNSVHPTLTGERE